MNSFIKQMTSSVHVHAKKWALNVALVLVGSILLSVSALISVPMYPVPMSLQTLAVFIIGLSLTPRLALLTVISYLVEATAGMPILAGGVSNPLWMIGPKSGYLFGFAISAYLISYLFEKMKRQSFLSAVFAVACGQIVIYILGVGILSCFIGLQKAIAVGFTPFISTMIIKLLLAATTYKPSRWLRKKVQNG